MRILVIVISAALIVTAAIVGLFPELAWSSVSSFNVLSRAVFGGSALLVGFATMLLIVANKKKVPDQQARTAYFAVMMQVAFIGISLFCSALVRPEELHYMSLTILWAAPTAILFLVGAVLPLFLLWVMSPTKDANV
jgi:uncharacterized membrane protein